MCLEIFSFVRVIAQERTIIDCKILIERLEELQLIKEGKFSSEQAT